MITIVIGHPWELNCLETPIYMIEEFLKHIVDHGTPPVIMLKAQKHWIRLFTYTFTVRTSKNSTKKTIDIKCNRNIPINSNRKTLKI